MSLMVRARALSPTRHASSSHAHAILRAIAIVIVISLGCGRLGDRVVTIRRLTRSVNSFLRRVWRFFLDVTLRRAHSAVMAEANELTQVVYLRLTPSVRARVRKWRERANRTAPNPYNEADAMRALIVAGLNAGGENA